ncbi:recombinase family protein [Phycicoccus avicenniae]|uniref:recombinase family protein n=1 Tax=Phycicoccus avicenniae TaxID=2828860 RepID=UPI003D2E7798
MRAGIQARVSLDRNGRSVPEQVDECKAWAAREGWDVVEVITETGSASRFARSTQARTRWDDVVALVASGRIDILLTWEASRATRQLEEYAELRNLCAKHGVKWGYSGTVYDLTERDARFRTGLDALLAEDESARTSERIQRAVRARAAAGTPHGKLPYGYRREYDPQSGALLRQVPDETTGPIAREIITRVASGDSFYAVAADLTDRGVPLPRPARGRHNAGDWLSTTVKRIALSPTYAGLRVHKGEVVGEATWPALVDRATHERAVAAIENAAAGRPRLDRTVKHLLTGIARCGVCGGPVVHHVNRGRYAAYICRTRFCVTRTADPAEQHVTALLLELLALLDDTTPADTEDADVTAAREKVAALHTRRSSFIDQAADGALSAAALARVEARLLPQIADAETELRALQRPRTLARFDLSDPRALWDGLSIIDRRDLVAATVDVTILPSTPGRSFKPETVRVTPRW